MIKAVAISTSIAVVAVVGGLCLYKYYKKTKEIEKAKMCMNRSKKYDEYILTTKPISWVSAR